jgi:hypothetical protein
VRLVLHGINNGFLKILYVVFYLKRPHIKKCKNLKTNFLTIN